MLHIKIAYVDIPDYERDSIDAIIAMAKQHPDYVAFAANSDYDHSIYFALDFGSEVVTATFR